MCSGQGLGVRGAVIRMRYQRTVAVQLMLSLFTLLVLVLTVAGCSGSKVTTKSSSELSRYQIRTIALVPFTTLATPQVKDAGDMYLSTPQSVKRSDTVSYTHL